MYRKIVWCYVFILTLLDISLNTQLTAQGKSHGVTVHDTLIEGVTLQEWGKDNNGEVFGGGDGGEGGAESDAEGVRLRPAALNFGRAALAAAHARTVTLTNTANTTLHLASVAGTTPDFHASFFEAKTLPPQGNTTFSVVYLGRREGPVAAHLYIHTSLGVHKYPVSAVGVASQYDVWPLVGVRVPLNASVEPELTLYNPTDHTVQVSEVYSSGAWLGLRLPGGGARAPRALWAVPPRAARPLVRLRLAPPPAALHPLTAYIRIKADIPGGGLVVAVEARSAPAGEHARPLQLRLRARGSRDPPHTVEVELSNSGGLAVPLEASVRARCGAPEPEPCAAAPPPDRANGGAGGAGGAGARVQLLRAQLEPHEDFTPVARLTLDYGELWAQAGGAGEAGEAWCAGCVRVGRAAVPYSVRLLAGALALQPDALEFVTAEREAALRPRELRATNQFLEPLHVHALHLPPDVHEHFHVEELTPLALRAGEGATVARLTMRARAVDAVPALALAARATLRTNLSDYSVPLTVYSGRFSFEWEWPNATDAALELGALGVGEGLEVRARLRNTGPASLCLAELGARLPPATVRLHLLDEGDGSTVCVPGGGWVDVVLSVRAPERAGSAAGTLWARSEHARTELAVRLRALPGRLVPRALLLPPAAPYVWSSAEVVVDNSMEKMAVVGASVGGDRAARWAGGGALAKGVALLGTLTYAPEYECAPHCYTGLDLDSPEGENWAQRAAADEGAEHVLGEDVALLLERLALFERHAARTRNLTLHVRTTEVVQLEVVGTARLRWPRLASARAGAAGAAAVGGAAALRLLLRNPARAPLLLHALLADRPHTPHLPHLAGGDSMFCERAHCVWARDAWALSDWRVTRGRAARWGPATTDAPHNGSSLPALLLQPDSEVELKITFAPQTPDPLTTYLFLRNNLTILEGVQLWGQGAVASFEVGGRRPGSASPILFEVSECAAEGEAGAGVVRRSVVVRNTGRVGVRLRDWRVAGRPCAARGFRVQPCAALQLAPNASRLLHLAYAADFTLARAHAVLQLRSELGVAEFTLAATTPAKLLPRCAAGARPPWDAPVRAGAWVLALATFAVVLIAGAVDAERSMRSLRAVRSPPRPPLDLRRAPPAPEEQPVPEPRAPRRRRPARRPQPPLDPQAERRAFERWRTEMMRREEEDDDSRSSEDPDSDEHDRGFEPPPLAAPCRESPPPCYPPPSAPLLAGADEDTGSSGSDASTPIDERDDNEVEPYEAENEATTREPSPVRLGDSPRVPTTARREPFPSNAEVHVRATRSRRERAESLRRSERTRVDLDTSQARTAPTAAAVTAAAARHHARREKTSKRRPPAPPTPARTSPCAAATTADSSIAAESGLESGSNGSNGSNGSRGLVRSGATWSSVVGGAAPLPPIGSDVRRREPPSERVDRADRSLFYFNGDATRTDSDYPWAAPTAHLGLPAHPAPADRPIFSGPSHDYMAEPSPLATDTFGGLGVWGGGGAWPWSAPLRPPPGFGAPRSPVRPYDPFRSLASIWAPGAADWRPAAPAPVAPPAPVPGAPPAPDLDDK